MFFFFFFSSRRRHTRSLRDWSSDVCSSDLGDREAAIAVATGEKQAAILGSEGARQSAILRAEGFALALETVFAVAKTVDNKTMSLQYLDALRSLGSSPSTKFVVPMEFTTMLQPL